MPRAIGKNKVCSKCHIEKSILDFQSNSWSNDGLNYQCKTCRKSFFRYNYERHKEASKLAMRRYRAKKGGINA